jgi:hypothetical protein
MVGAPYPESHLFRRPLLGESLRVRQRIWQTARTTGVIDFGAGR